MIILIWLRAVLTQDDIDKTNQEIIEAQKEIDRQAVLHDKLISIKQWNLLTDAAKTNISTMPFLDQAKFDEIKKIMKEKNATYVGFDYDEEKGYIVLREVAVNTQKEVKILCDAFKASKYVAHVGYPGYEGVGVELDSSGKPIEASTNPADSSSKKDPNADKVVIKELTLELKGTGEIK